jgi:hypothetical protein
MWISFKKCLPQLEFHIFFDNLRQIFRELCSRAREEFHVCFVSDFGLSCDNLYTVGPYHVVSWHVLVSPPLLIYKICIHTLDTQEHMHGPTICTQVYNGK